MLKTKKQIIEDLDLIDIVIEILDARIPKSSQNADIQKVTASKNKIIILNKSDLADEKETTKWISHFENNNIVAIATDANLGKGIKQVIQAIRNASQESIQKNVKRGISNKSVRIMIIGIPNVGKSSFINRMINKKSTKVGNRPGVTRQKQWVKIFNNIELLDTPGVLWPKFDDKTALNLSYCDAIKDEVLDKTEIAYAFIKNIYPLYKTQILDRYKVSEEELTSIQELDKTLGLIELIGKKRGTLISGGEIDYAKISGIILNDFRSGKLGKITLEKVNEN